MLKKHLSALVLLLGIVGLFAYTNLLHRSSTTPSASPVLLTTVSSTGTSSSTTAHTTTVTRAGPAAPAKVGVTIKVGSATYAVPFTDGDTALDAMRSAKGAGFTFAGRDYAGLGFFVDSIDGKKDTDDYYWILYLNGATSTLGASAQKVHQFDIVEWRYEKDY